MKAAHVQTVLTTLLFIFSQQPPSFVHAFIISTPSILHISTGASRQHQTASYRRSVLIANRMNEHPKDEGIGDFKSRRMDIVRILQKSYYRSMDDDEDVIGGDFGTRRRTNYDETTGRILNLPLWRVGWVETPGRRNCLNVHEGQYTHMFETILSQSKDNDQPMYFGHLYVPGGSSNARRNPEYQVKTWEQELEDESRFDVSILDTFEGSSRVNGRAAVIGCLMQVVDYRRMNDGRLMILVQAVERFVVDEIVETTPYAVANVQILLDEEELPWIHSSKFVGENTCKFIRGKAVSASFMYHDYEFDKPKLPIPDSRNADGDSEVYLSKEDVPWIDISMLLPFAHYSTDDVSLTTANERRAWVEKSCLDLKENASGSLPLEQQLQNGGLLWKPPPLMTSNVVIRRPEDLNDCDTLETLLWLALNDFCRAAQFKLPEEVSCLLPSEIDYLDITPMTTLSPKYPKIRRQLRLSYLAPALIENLEAGKDLRQVWLNTPSTNARLRGALERFDYLNGQLMGEFM
ncbi:hypothetical protein ACHAWO_002879 [Cyclotella atomus]|uniref:Lon N-terminal domain-containing protein n=1 Tax=Cyclotella atomus TaxID=382360 RepID=A0ABD3QPJ3_9STRA